MTGQVRVSVQSWQTPGRATRWSYVLHGSGMDYVSAYRYRSADSARRAGTSDALQCARFEGSDVSVSYPELPA